jgi:hypothetical protein
MSEANAGVLVADEDDLEAKEQAWLTAMTLIRSRMWPLFDEGPTSESLELAQDLADELLRAVDDFRN